MKKQILLLCLALISLCGYAQQITVKGVVTSATDQQPLIGTTVQVKGTGTGTITGIDGDYTLPNVDKNAVLVFSSIGFESQEIAVGGRTTINVVLKEAAELLDEVVVIGYGAVKKSDLTSSIATVKGDEITETVTGNAMDALQGKVNGVQVTSGGGKVRLVKPASIGILLLVSRPWPNLILPVRLNIKKCSIPVIRMMAFLLSGTIRVLRPIPVVQTGGIL